MQLRSYQQKAIEGLQEKFKENKKKVLLVAVMSAGKTIMASRMIQLAVKNGKRVLFIAHRRELIDQAADKLKKFSGIDSGMIISGVQPDYSQKVQIASVQTLIRRNLPKADLVIVDEAHNCLSPSYQKVLEYYKDKHVVGLTATPMRGNPRQYLGQYFEDYVYPITSTELIELGFLVPTKVYTMNKIVSTAFSKKRGEFDEKEVFKAFDVENAYINLVQNYFTFVHGRKFIMFCVNVEHSKKCVEVLKDKGIRIEHLDGGTDLNVRKQMIKDLEDGKIMGISNVNCLSEGTDIPSVTAVIYNKSTASPIRYYQEGGRGMRTYEGKKECIILDLSDNTLRFGFLEEPIEVDIFNNKKEAKKGVPATKECPECHRIVHARTTTCPECNFVFPIDKNKKKTPTEEIFIELEKKKLQAVKYKDCKVYDVPTELLKEWCELKGFRKGYLKYELARRGEGRKIVQIVGYKGDDYFKQKNWLEKAYYNKIPIDGHTYVFEKETEVNIVFRYIAEEKETEDQLIF